MNKYSLAKGWSFLALLIIFTLILLPSFDVMASKGDLMDFKSDLKLKVATPLNVTLGKAELFTVKGDVADILVANPAVVDVVAVQSNRLYVVGLSVGDTNIIALNSEGEIVSRLDVHITYDLQAMQSLLEDLFPSEQVRIGSIHDQIILTGVASTPQAASKISHFVAHYVSDLQDEDGTIDELVANLMEVRGEQQVMLQVRVIEASRTLTRDLGISATTSGGTGNKILNVTPSAAGIGITTSAATFEFLTPSNRSGLGLLDFELDALEDKGLVNVLAEPNLTSISGEQAGFLAGGEFPVPSGLDSSGNIIIEYREFGVSLNFRPVVLSGERISLQLNTEVSSLDFTNAVTLQNVTVPALDIRRAETTVEIPSGGSLMIAGLLQSEAVEGMAGLPGVNKTPVLGRLLSSENFSRDETELIVVVTPFLVKPFANEEVADAAPDENKHPLAAAFARNVRRIFSSAVEDDILAAGSRYGYLVR